VDEFDSRLWSAAFGSCFVHVTDSTHRDERGTVVLYTPRDTSNILRWFEKLGSTCDGTVEKKVEAFIFVVTAPSLGGSEVEFG